MDNNKVLTSLMNPNQVQVKNENKLLIIQCSNDIKTILSDVKYLRSEISEIKKQIAQFIKDEEPVVVEKSTGGWFY